MGKNIFTKRQTQNGKVQKYFHKKAEKFSEQVINVAAQDKNKDIKGKKQKPLKVMKKR